MDLKFADRETFYICGYYAETCLDTCGTDIPKLWNEFKNKKELLYDKIGKSGGLYGLMWYTENHRYCYLYGIEADEKSDIPEGACLKCIPKAHYAIYEVPADMSAVEAWTVYFEEVLPKTDYIPDAEHGMYFEFYPDYNQSGCQLWTPVRNTK